MKITFLTENKTQKEGVFAEHGLSIYIETMGKKILFDSGASSLVIRNANMIGVDLTKIDFAVASHGWGSSGTGGAIKVATKEKLRQPQMKGIVRDIVSGEMWMEKKKIFIDVCPQLKDFNRYVDGNKGVTVVLLK